MGNSHGSGSVKDILGKMTSEDDKLNLRRQKIDKLPVEFFPKLNHITKLSLQDNFLTTLPPEIAQLESLRFLYLSKNKIKALPKEMSKLANLELLDVHNNQLAEFPRLEGLLKLKKLVVRWNFLKSIAPKVIRSLKNLIVFDASNNEIVEVPVELAECRKLELLLLNGNRIKNYAKELVRLPFLRKLNLSHNRLSKIPAAIADLPNLEWLDIRNNPHLHKLRPELVELGKRIEVQTSLPDEILPKVWIGPGSGETTKILKRRGIKNILRITRKGTPPSSFANEPGFTYKDVNIADKETEELRKFFPTTNTFIAKGRDSGGIFIHSRQGKSRCAAVVIAFVMKEKGLSFSDSLAFVRSRRPSIEPNDGFRSQLLSYELDRKLFVEPKKNTKEEEDGEPDGEPLASPRRDDESSSEVGKDEEEGAEGAEAPPSKKKGKKRASKNKKKLDGDVELESKGEHDDGVGELSDE